MKNIQKFILLPHIVLILSILLIIPAQNTTAANFQEFIEYKGKVVESLNGNPIPAAFLSVNGTNISTVTNNDGEFSLKVPVNISSATVTISNLGFQNKTHPLSFFNTENTRIELDETLEELSEVNIFTATDAKALVQNMFSKAGDNYLNDPVIMNSFYREAIKKGRRNVSLTEAVLKIYKRPYTSSGRDEISITKARKSVDYERLDTMALKLRGGPFNTLYSDIIKYPQYLFNVDQLEEYTFSFGSPARINNKYLYVVNFEMIDKRLPWLFGELYIDAQTNALVKANYHLNVDNRSVAGNMFVRKKPGGVKVYPIRVEYQVDYRESGGKWYYGYGSAELEFVVNWKRKLFNSRYTVNSEMAVTNWQTNPGDRVQRDKTFISPAVIMADDVSGFSDEAFWGANNIIEPEKSIQNAIEKIQRSIQ